MTITLDPPATGTSTGGTPSDSSPADEVYSPATPLDRILLAVLLLGTAALYLANITVNGNANNFYAGAAWAGSKNWEALLFGSVDPANFITVDKPPVSQWVMGLSGQIFGYSSASMLIPEALMGVAAVALLYAAVTRIAGRQAGLVAGLGLAVTPVAAMMFRFNNPDAAMVLLMTAGAYCTVRAIPRGSWKWLALAGVALGFAFLTKMLEGLMVVPALGLAYLIAAPISLGRRIRDLMIAVVALIASAGWYVVLTLLWPASSRPYLAGSDDNNFMNLVIGYNGLDRLKGHSGGHGGSGMPAFTDNPEFQEMMKHAGGGMFASPAGLTRLFGGEFGGEISFLLPSAIIAFVLVMVLRGAAPRTDMMRAGTLVFGVWLLVDAVVLSYMGGIAHPYYSLAIAPPIAAVVAVGVAQCWRARNDSVAWRRHTARYGMAAMILAGGIWSFVVLARQGEWMPWLRWLILVATVVAVVAWLIPARGRTLAIGAVVLGVLAAVAAPTAYAVAGDTVAHTGGGPTVLPKVHTGRTDASTSGAGALMKRMGGMDGSPLTPELTQMLQSSTATWAAAVDRTSTAAAIELAARVPVMGIGGFTHDPAPSLAQFQEDVAHGRIGYYLQSTTGLDRMFSTMGASQSGRSDSGHESRTTSSGFRSSVSTEIQQWVSTHFHATTIGDYTVYNLHQPLS